MNYKRIYDSIIVSASGRWKVSGIHENHHIIPVCLGGSDDKNNIVALTIREHYICHWLLTKIYPSNASVLFAFNMMHVSNSLQIGRGYSKRYASLRSKLSEYMSSVQSGRIFVTKDNKNKRINPEELEQYVMDGWELGRCLSEEHIKSIQSVERRGVAIHSEEWKNDLSESMAGSNNPFYGRSHTQEAKQKIAKANSRPRTEDFKQKIKDISASKRRAKEDLYYQNPSLCQHCSTVIPYNKRNSKYCSISCSNSHRPYTSATLPL